MKVQVLTSKNLAKSGGIQTVTKTLFENVFPIYYAEDHTQDAILTNFEKGDIALFSGFSQELKVLAKSLKEKGVKIAVFWHFSTSSSVDEDIRIDWEALQDILKTKEVDLFISCKPNLPIVIELLYGVKGFFIMNNSFASQKVTTPKKGIGIYSGSSDYWAKNMQTNVMAALLTGEDVDILPLDATISQLVETCHAQDRVSGIASGLPHDEFMERMASRELVTYCTFVEGAPILPLEALNSGTLCLTGNNHHYWEDDPVLRKHLVVNDVEDPKAIYDAITRAIQNKKIILFKYNLWKKRYDREQDKNFAELLQVLQSL